MKVGKKKKCLFLPFHCQDTFLPGSHRIQGKLKYLLIKRLRISLLKTTMKAMGGRIYFLICQIRKLSPGKVKKLVRGILAKMVWDSVPLKRYLVEKRTYTSWNRVISGH